MLAIDADSGEYMYCSRNYLLRGDIARGGHVHGPFMAGNIATPLEVSRAYAQCKASMHTMEQARRGKDAAGCYARRGCK